MVSGSITSGAASVTTTGSYENTSKIGSNDLAGASASAFSMLSNGTSIGPEKTTKRTHALIELLTSERVYASDLAVMRTVYMPMALGLSPTIQPPPPTPTTALPIASAFSTTATGSNPSHDTTIAEPEVIHPCMRREDVRIIFSNTEDLGVFADAFVESIEAAMGDVVLSTAADGDLPTSTAGPNGDGPVVRDSIGALFLEAVSEDIPPRH